MPTAASKSARIIETDFARLEDGRLIEMIENSKDPQKSLFVIYKNGRMSYANTVNDKNRTFVPLPRRDQLLKHMNFPQGVRSYQSVDALGTDIGAFLSKCLEMDSSSAILVPPFVLSTWVPERLSVTAYLAFVGPPGSGKTTALRVLSLLCRHALLTDDLSSAAFYDLYERLTPTLLVDETLTAGDRRSLFHVLRTGSTRGSIALRKARSFQAFGPKVISWTQLPKDPALNSRCIVIPLLDTTRTDLLKPDDNRVVEAAAKLRMALLDYRLRNLDSLHLPKIDGDERLTSRTRDLYQALALPVGSHKVWCEALVHLLEHQREINREELSPCSAAVLRELYLFIHVNADAVRVANKEITVAVNLNPEALKFNAHEVGRALTAIGLTDRKRTNIGYMLQLSLRTRERIHKLAHDYGIDQELSFKINVFGCKCALCAQSALTKRDLPESKQDPGARAKRK